MSDRQTERKTKETKERFHKGNINEESVRNRQTERKTKDRAKDKRTNEKLHKGNIIATKANEYASIVQ